MLTATGSAMTKLFIDRCEEPGGDQLGREAVEVRGQAFKEDRLLDLALQDQLVQEAHDVKKVIPGGKQKESKKRCNVFNNTFNLSFSVLLL